MRILINLVSLIISFVWLWILNHLVVTPLELLVFVLSIIVFTVLWFFVIRAEYSGNESAKARRKNLGYVVFSFQFAYIIFRILNLQVYENLAFIIFTTSLLGLPVLGGHQLIKDKVFE